MTNPLPVRRGEAESSYAWGRLVASLAHSTLGGVGMWSVVVVLPTVQAEFGVARADASLPYTLTMILFGLGGIVPSYAIIVREYFPPQEAGARVATIITATLFGMAFGGWASGAVFDLTGSYAAAFANGILWNLLNMAIAGWLLWRSGLRYARA